MDLGWRGLGLVTWRRSANPSKEGDANSSRPAAWHDRKASSNDEDGG
jgi:hypothetical protein